MNNIFIDDGLKEFTINNDETRVIRFNPSDMSMLHRLEEIQKNIEEKSKEFGDRKIDAESEKKLSTFICEQIDYFLNCKASDVVFRGTSPLTSINGVTYYEKFLEAIQPIIEKEIKQEKKASEKRIAKYTDKYKGSK